MGPNYCSRSLPFLKSILHIKHKNLRSGWFDAIANRVLKILMEKVERKEFRSKFSTPSFQIIYSVAKRQRNRSSKNELELSRWRSYLYYKSNEFKTIWFHSVHIILIIKIIFSITRPLFFQNIIEHSKFLFQIHLSIFENRRFIISKYLSSYFFLKNMFPLARFCLQ